MLGKCRIIIIDLIDLESLLFRTSLEAGMIYTRKETYQLLTQNFTMGDRIPSV